MPYATLKSILVLLGLLAAFGVFFWRVYQLLWVNLRRGQPSPPFRQWTERVLGLLVFVGGQLRLFHFLIPGTAHFFIFWGFLLLFPTILQAILEGLLGIFDPELHPAPAGSIRTAGFPPGSVRRPGRTGRALRSLHPPGHPA